MNLEGMRGEAEVVLPVGVAQYRYLHELRDGNASSEEEQNEYENHILQREQKQVRKDFERLIKSKVEDSDSSTEEIGNLKLARWLNSEAESMGSKDSDPSENSLLKGSTKESDSDSSSDVPPAIRRSWKTRLLKAAGFICPESPYRFAFRFLEQVVRMGQSTGSPNEQHKNSPSNGNPLGLCSQEVIAAMTMLQSRAVRESAKTEALAKGRPSRFARHLVVAESQVHPIVQQFVENMERLIQSAEGNGTKCISPSPPPPVVKGSRHGILFRSLSYMGFGNGFLVDSVSEGSLSAQTSPKVIGIIALMLICLVAGIGVVFAMSCFRCRTSIALQEPFVKNGGSARVMKKLESCD